MPKEIFKKEVAICKEQYSKNKGCAWGKCEYCGVLLLLQKLYRGEIVEDQKAVKKFKDNLLK